MRENYIIRFLFFNSENKPALTLIKIIQDIIFQSPDKDSLFMPTIISFVCFFNNHYLTMSLGLVQNLEQNNRIRRRTTPAALFSKARGKKPHRIIGLISNSGKVSH